MAILKVVTDIAEMTGVVDAIREILMTGRVTQEEIPGDYIFVERDSAREKIFVGTTAATWRVPVFPRGQQTTVHNMGTAPVTFVADGVTFKGLTHLAPDKTAALIWLPRNIVKLIGELS